MVFTKYAANAIIAKTRAKYGKRLKDKDYQALLNCASVGEVMAYLKSHTHYSSVLNNMSEREVHRGQLETVLRQQLIQDFASIAHYEIATGEAFSQFLINRNEVEQLSHFVMLLSSGNTERYVFDLPLHFEAHTKIDLQALVKARSYGELLAAVEKTKYKKLLEPYRPEKDGEIDVPAIENALYSDMYDNLFEIIGNHTKGEEKKALTELFTTHIDLMNFVRVLRLQKYFHLKPEKIREQLLPHGSIRESVLKAMCEARSPKELFAAAAASRAGKRIAKMEYSYAGEIDRRGDYSYTKRQIRFSTVPTVVMMSYFTLAQTELTNIINIIEGVRYKVDPDTIKKLLIYQ
ncbi:MAG: V0D/AC39 family V-type ATPase subunit [Acutalibacteraceae bacterium]